MRFAPTRFGLVLVVGLAACTSFGGDSEIVGVWEMVSFVEGGAETTVTEDVNTASVPHIEFGETSYGGVGGCNGFGTGDDGYEFDGGTFDPGDPIFESALCVPESLMSAEYALVEMLWAADPIAVDIDGDVMIWHQGSRRIHWRSIDEVPPPPTLPPQTTVGDLDCGDRELVTNDVPSGGTSAEEVALAAEDGVVEVVTEGDLGHFATGYDADGDAVVVVQFQDQAPFPYRIYTCP